MLRLAAQSWVDGFPNLRFFRYAIVPLVVSLRGKSDDAKVTLFTSLILFFTGLLKPGSQNARTPPLDEKRRFWTRGRPQTYIWMSRELGTQMQDVNDFLMKDCPSPVEDFLHESDCPLVFVVEVTERWSLRGNLYELSIPVAQELRDNAVKVHPLYHYENGNVLTQENKDELSWYEQGQLGNLMRIEYIPDDPFEMKSAKTGLRQRCMNMKEGSFEDYLEKLEQRYKKLHKEWSIKEENVLEL